jgi:2-iminobutanoate/2-iminopropanoate deaminase
MNAFAEILETIAHAPIEKRTVTNHDVLNETYCYAKPSSFSRGMRIDLNGLTILLISGTASIDENGVSVYMSATLKRSFETHVRQHHRPA